MNNHPLLGSDEVHEAILNEPLALPNMEPCYRPALRLPDVQEPLSIGRMEDLPSHEPYPVAYGLVRWVRPVLGVCVKILGGALVTWFWFCELFVPREERQWPHL